MRIAIGTVGMFVAVWGGAACLWLIHWWQFSSLGGWPSNDDPFYAKPLQLWSQDGSWQSVKQAGELTASALAHQAVGLVATADHHFAYHRLFLVCIAQQSLGVAALFCTARALELSNSAAFLAAASLAYFPLYFGHAFTFMTDGPATAWALAACCCFVLGIARDKLWWSFAGSCAVGWGLWIRQTNGFLLAAPVVTWLILIGIGRWPPGHRWQSISAVLLPAGCAVGLLESGSIIESSPTRLESVAPALDSGYLQSLLIAAYGALLLIGWLMLPWMVVAAGWASSLMGRQGERQRRICLAAAALTLVVGMTPLVITGGNACLTSSTGTFVQNAHFGPIFLSDMDEPGRWSDLGGVAWPMWTWKLLSILAVTNCAVIAWWSAWSVCEFFSQARIQATGDRIGLLTMATGLLAACSLAGAFLLLCIEPHMDRYWLFVHAMLAIWWLVVLAIAMRGASERKLPLRWSPVALGWACGCIALNFSVSTIFTHDMLAWNNVRWQYIQKQLVIGTRAELLDGGRDVNAWLRLDEDVNSMPRAGDSTPWWSGRAVRSLAIGQRPGWHQVDRLPWDSWATGQRHYLLVLERDAYD